MRKLGLVVFSSHSGLGNQSRRLTQFLRPERLLLIDSTPFSKNKEQHPEWYDGFEAVRSNGFPNRQQVLRFLQGLTHLYLIENPLNWDLVTIALQKDIKVYIASNFEFCDNLIKPYLPVPTLFLMPSRWKVDEMKFRFGDDRVRYLPPPIFPNDFTEVREKNMNRTGKKRFLHVVGTLAAADRNGTLILLSSLKHNSEDFELVIKSQHPLPEEYQTDDHRVKYQIGSQPEVADIYNDFDAMFMPRRFGGLCLPMQEALMSGLPVIMPAVSPNAEVLPEKWTVPAYPTGAIQTRSQITLFAADVVLLSNKIKEFATRDLSTDKIEAFDLAHREFAPSSLQEEYDKLWI